MHGTITLADQLPTITGIVTINGPTPTFPGIFIDGNKQFGIFDVAFGAQLTLTNLNLVNGTASQGGAIQNAGSLMVTDCTLASNDADTVGGAIYNDGGTVVLFNSTLFGNSAGFEGSVIFDAEGGSIAINDCTIASNFSQINQHEAIREHSDNSLNDREHHTGQQSRWELPFRSQRAPHFLHQWRLQHRG